MISEAKWIACLDAAQNGDGSYLFRKTFTLTDLPRKALLSICGLGLGVYEINGEPVTDEVLHPPFTRYDRRAIYGDFDVTGLLREGENVLCAHVGNGWYNDNATVWDFEKADWRHHPKLAASLSLEFADRKETILSGPSWKSAPGPALFNHMRCGETYDARLLSERWNKPGFDDGAWERARVCPGPGGLLETTDMPPIRVISTLPMKKIGENRYDVGQNLSGWVRIRVKGRAGAAVNLQYAEHIREDGSLDDHISVFLRTEQKHRERYILSGKGEEVYEPSFCYHGFRYVDVTVEGEAELLSIETRLVHTDLAVVGEFSCGDDTLNKIHAMARWSTLTNYHGIPTDCPHREQNGWTGDALLSANQCIMNYDMAAAYKKWLRDFKDVQRPNGQLPGIVPTSGWGFNWGSGPAWDSALIHLPWYLYDMTGDDSAVRLMWDNMERYMDYMASMADDYLVDYGLGDWCPPPGAAVCPTVVTDTGYYYSNAVIMARCAPLVGRDGSGYEALARAIRAAYLKAFSGDEALRSSQTFLGCGLYQGIYEGEEAKKAAADLAALVEAKGNHIDCGILGTKYVLFALSDHGYDELVYRMITNPTMPSYAYWIEQGLTAMAEQWNLVTNQGKLNSLNHHMFSSVDLWFFERLAGIRLSREGVLVKPSFVPGVAWAEASHRDISVSWDEKEVRISCPLPFRADIAGKMYDLAAGEHTLAR